VSVPFLDLARSHRPLRAGIDAALARVLDSGQFILGPEASALEAEVARACGAAHGVAVASGTDALFLALAGLDVGPGCEVVTTPFTFVATAGAVARTGARPIFADIDPSTFNLDPAAAAAAAGPRTRAILPVDLYGLPADWEAFEALAAARGLALVEDAAQAIGAARGGRPAGSFGAAAAVSFYPTKNLGGMGDGGILLTGDAFLAARARLLRAHGDAGGYDHREVGMNSRLDAFQAAVLRVKLRHLPAWSDERRRIAAGYDRRLDELFSGAGPAGVTAASAGRPVVRPAAPPPGTGHAYHQYTIRAHRRDELRASLTAAGVGCAVYYPTPLHLQPCFAALGGRRGDLPEAERAAAEVLSLPIYPGLTASEQDEVCEAVASFYGVRV
jgi:dTDP-4-amino-4,6-dideoxygalactose transaminase